MKSVIKSSLLAIAGAGLFALPASGAVSLENGSLAVAFYQVIGGVVQNNTLVVDLGQASLYRENTGYNVSVSTVNPGIANSNIGGALSNAFGSTWADSGTVRWMVVGGVAAGPTGVSGDPSRTSYLSTGVSDFNVGTTFPSDLSSSNRSQVSGQITQFFGSVQNETATVGNADAAQLPISDASSIDEFVTGGGYFTLGHDITQTLGAGTIANGPHGLVFEGALDIYRLINTTTGADLTASYSNGNAAVGSPQYIGTLALDSLGNLSVIPEPSAALLGLLGVVTFFHRRRSA
ncbi:hypothetical protein JIN84_06395 [Luteolibacter yonseiensis]|uniref:PEP-CTERM protein-sorting domain-containing protein n=1 Tax=Luteolibacter yonseiensis TaxID=1144680 RepID=A0A934R1T4_9BACT|nr:hypothetical protein [Luteolibacter yonseiensis]MBK1815234.1 hypothetical protein [Luteolibacter yonseiensis]